MPKGVYPRTPEHGANIRAAQKQFHKEHPNATKEWFNTPEARANRSAGSTKAQNTPEEFALIQQYGHPLIIKLREKYALNDRCNNPNNPAYHNYGGREIRNLFASRLHFLNYVINELGITTIEQIEGLEIDRIDGNYEPGNIRFVTRKVNANNKRKRM